MLSIRIRKVWEMETLRYFAQGRNQIPRYFLVGVFFLILGFYSQA